MKRTDGLTNEVHSVSKQDWIVAVGSELEFRQNWQKSQVLCDANSSPFYMDFTPYLYSSKGGFDAHLEEMRTV